MESLEPPSVATTTKQPERPEEMGQMSNVLTINGEIFFAIGLQIFNLDTSNIIQPFRKYCLTNRNSPSLMNNLKSVT